MPTCTRAQATLNKDGSVKTITLQGRWESGQYVMDDTTTVH